MNLTELYIVASFFTFLLFLLILSIGIRKVSILEQIVRLLIFTVLWPITWLVLILYILTDIKLFQYKSHD